MSNEDFYRPCNFHFNILGSFEVIAKPLSVALEVSLSIILHVHPQYASHIYKILKEYIESLRLISLYALWSLLFIMRNGKKIG